MPEAPTDDGTARARRRADAMVGLMVAAVVAALAAGAVLATDGSVAFAAGLLVAAVAFGAVSVLLLRSITPEERARLVPPKEEGSATDDQAPERPR